MNYFVIGNDGQKYGPADIATLNQWAQEGRLTPTTMLEDAATGQQTMASQMPGISFPVAAPGAPSYGPTYQAGNFTPGGMMDDGSGDITKVWIFSVLAIIPCCPLIFGILAIVFASNAQKKGHPQGQTAMIIAVVALIVGIGITTGVNLFGFRGFR
ncbi:MAG: hypothetical protein GC165_02415 [Armatimonadetes bacterium]|nr:hypothetical protein [Armatimonadota bacterium]